MSCETNSLASDARRRAARLNDPDRIQGIDYIETLDHEVPHPRDLRRRILLVHCFLSLPEEGRVNVRIEGEPESTPPRVQWALPAEHFQSFDANLDLQVITGESGSARPLLKEELKFFQTLSQQDTLLIVHIVPQIAPDEDRGTYRLFLSLGSDTGKALDWRLASATFSLDSEGPTDVDCAPLRAMVRARQPSPPIDYLAKDYASFRTLMLDRMAVVMPEWAERSPADIGVTLVELIAHVGDQLSYYQDGVATEAYLGTARRRTSVRRHARLLDYALHEGNNARVWISLEVNQMYEEDHPGAAGTIPAGTRLLTRLENEPRIGLPEESLSEALRQKALFFETLQDIAPKMARNCIVVYDWGGGLTCLPRGATSATLCARADLDLHAGDVLIFEEIDDPSTGTLADLTRRHAVRLLDTPEAIVDELGPDSMLLVEVIWHPDDALPFAMPIRHASGAQATIARGNVVLADHGRTIEQEPLLPEIAPADERYRPHVRGLHLTHRQPYTDAQLSSAAALLVQDPRRALPVVSMAELPEHSEAGCADEPTPWHPRRDLLASGPFDRHFAIEMERDGRASVRFGDNVNGRQPPVGSRWRATYRVGSGSAGNIGADAIAHVLVSQDSSPRSLMMLFGIDVIRNPLPAVGGMEPERDEQARLYAPYSFRQGERAVTADDYAEVTERHPEVQKAIAQIRWTGSWDTVFVTIDRRGGLPLDTAFENELRSYLEPFRMAGQDLEFSPPQFVPLDIALTIHVASDYLRSEVKAALLQVLGSGESASGKRGFFHPDNFTFGDPVYLSRIVAAAMKVPGVVWVDIDDRDGKPNRFRRFGQDSRGELGRGVIVVAPLEIIRLDNDPTAPHHGRIQLFMEGGL
ncbi:MAG TPA: putative baseplate assembly protein [Haliangium sp.]|nr:putative baseplate assembly protein [Haliangium sp.]